METATSNGNLTTSNSGKNKDKAPKKQRVLPPLNAFGSASNMTKVHFEALVSDEPIDFSNLNNNELFSQSQDGSFPMIRVSRSKATSLHDGKAHTCGSGRCYRISILGHPIIEKSQGGKE
jgi:hypothetical protein